MSAPRLEPELTRDWRILLGCSLCATVGIAGLVSYSSGVMLAALHEAFGWSLESLTATQLAAMTVLALGSPFAGMLVDRYGPLRVITMSIVAEALLFACLGLMSQNFTVYVVLNVALVVCGLGATTPSVLRVVTATFVRKRGMALGIVIGAMGLLAIITPLVISRVVAEGNWRGGYFVLAAWALAAGIASVLIMKSGEARRKLRSSDVAVSAGDLASDRGQLAIVERPVKSALFWLLLLAFALPPLCTNGYLVLLASILRERGISMTSAGNLQALLGVAMLFARLLSGILMDRIRAHWVAAVTFVLTATGCLVLLYGGATATPAAAMLLGLTVGAEMDIMAYIVARYFGLERFGQIYGLYYGLLVIVGGGSSFVLSMIKKASGGLELMLLISTVGALTGAALILIAGRVGDNALRARVGRNPFGANTLVGNEFSDKRQQQLG